jgi:hypothetical protein
MALLQWEFPLDSPWLDRLAVGKLFLLIFRMGTMYRRRIRSSGGCFLYGRSEL